MKAKWGGFTLATVSWDIERTWESFPESLKTMTTDRFILVVDNVIGLSYFRLTQLVKIFLD